jgi:hypothetical protein
MLIDGSLLNEFIPTFKNEKTWATGSFQFIVKKKSLSLALVLEEPVTDMRPQFQA